MTDAIKLTTLTATIAAQVVSVTAFDGSMKRLKIRDITGMPQAINTQDCPVFAPRARDFVMNVSLQRDSFGADAALKSIAYDLTYQLFYYPMGEGANWLSYYGAMVRGMSEVLLYFATHTNNFTAAGASQDFIPQAVPLLAAQYDTAGTLFHGCEMTFHVVQFLEA